MVTLSWKESRADCQRVGQTVRESGRLSESREDCQKVGEAVRKSGRDQESQGSCSDVIVRETATSSSGKRRRHRQGNGDVISVTSVIATIS